MRLETTKTSWTLHATDKFKINERLPGVGWTMWEVWIRFVLASVGTSSTLSIPNEVLLHFKEPLNPGGSDQGNGNAAGDGAGGGSGVGGAQAGGGGAGGGGSGGTSSQGGQGGSSSTGGPTESGEPSDDRDDRGAAAGSEETFTLSYADLYDARRFEGESPILELAVPLAGDAEEIARGRVGSVYRKTIRGVDVVCKVLRIGERESDDEWREVLGEMQREHEAYNRLEALQGKVVPRFLAEGGYLGGCVQLLATEYAGASLDDHEDVAALPIARDVATRALAALDAVHAAGVLHGDVALRNFVMREVDGAVLVLDFGFAVFREEVEEEEWVARVARERAKLLEEMGWASVGELGVEAAATTTTTTTTTTTPVALAEKDVSDASVAQRGTRKRMELEAETDASVAAAASRAQGGTDPAAVAATGPSTCLLYTSPSPRD